MRLVNEALDNSPIPQNSSRGTLELKFSETKVNISAKHYKLFGCPVFVLDSALQLNKPRHKCKKRAKVGI